MIAKLPLLLVIGMAAMELAACGAVPQDSATPAPTAAAMAGMDHGTNSATTSAAPYDARFIDSMLMHHQGAIAMAKQAQTQAQRPEVKQLAQQIIGEQEAETRQMQQWRAAWYPDLPVTAGMGMAMGDMQIGGDGSTPFDQRFIAAMIPHHQSAVTMAQDALQHAQHAELKTLAQRIISGQEAEVAQMQQWQKAWGSS